jgi:hypothetical protein
MDMSQTHDGPCYTLYRRAPSQPLKTSTVHTSNSRIACITSHPRSAGSPSLFSSNIPPPPLPTHIQQLPSGAAGGVSDEGCSGVVGASSKRTARSACREWDKLVDMCSAELEAPPSARYDYVMYEYVGMVQVSTKLRNPGLREQYGKETERTWKEKINHECKLCY